MYFTIASCYMLTVVSFYLHLKKISPEGAKRRKRRIFVVSVSVSLIFYLRAALNLIRGIETFDIEWEERAWKNNDFWFPIYRVFYFLLVDILPIAFMLQSAKAHSDSRSISMQYSYKRGQTDGVEYDEVSDMYTENDRTTCNEYPNKVRETAVNDYSDEEDSEDD
jgi:hypothetical protein